MSVRVFPASATTHSSPALLPEQRAPERRLGRHDLHRPVRQSPASAARREPQDDLAAVFVGCDERAEGRRLAVAEGAERHSLDVGERLAHLFQAERLAAREVGLLESPRVLVVLGLRFLVGRPRDGGAVRTLAGGELGGEARGELGFQRILGGERHAVFLACLHRAAHPPRARASKAWRCK